MSRRVLIQSPILAAAEQYLIDNNCEIVRGSGTDKASVMKDIADCDAVVAKKAAAYTFDKELMDNAPNLKVIARFGVGIEIIDVDYAQEKGIIVTNSPRANNNAVAEHAMYLMLACAKNGLELDKKIRSGVFNSGKPHFAVELEGAVLGIVGCGHIGTLLARKAAGFGMKIIGYDPYLPVEKFVPEISRKETLEELLKEADFVSLHLPSTPSTIGLISGKVLRLMKKNAYLINTSRGEVVNEAELCDVLKDGAIAGAGLDVFEKEPLPIDSDLLKLDNVVLTPHYAAFTEGATARTAMEVVSDIVSVLDGKPAAHEVTKIGISKR